MGSKIPRPPEAEERRRLLAGFRRLLKDIDELVAKARGRSQVSAKLLEAIRRANEERIALARELTSLEDKILREILSPLDRGARAFVSAHRLGKHTSSRKD